MKILSLRYPDGGGKPQLQLMADSSVLLSGKPFFIPGFARQFTVSASLALRVSRLGKCIAERFAHRYYDSVAPAVVVSPEGILESEIADYVTATAFDGALWLGRFVAADGVDVAAPALEMAISGTRQCVASAQRLPLSPDAIIAAVSRQVTLKMGDIILTGNCTPAEHIAIGDTVTASLQGEEGLRIRVK